MQLFKGLSAFPLTPVTNGGEIDAKVLERFLQRLVEARVDSISLLGSTGGYAYFTTAQRQRALRTAIDCVQRKCQSSLAWVP